MFVLYLQCTAYSEQSTLINSGSTCAPALTTCTFSASAFSTAATLHHTSPHPWKE